jgi:hypothetical protein
VSSACLWPSCSRHLHLTRPKDKDLKKIGTFELANINQGLDAFLLRGFTMALQRSTEELQVLTALARKELFDPKNHLNVKL